MNWKYKVSGFGPEKSTRLRGWMKGKEMNECIGSKYWLSRH